MKLVTYYIEGGMNRLGALNKDGSVLDLLSAAESEGIEDAQINFASMLTLIESGSEVWDVARSLTQGCYEEHCVGAGGYALRAPIPVPPQIRDFMAFEKHVRQGFESALKMRAAREENPVAAEENLRATGRFDIPQAWYQQPMYYKGNRFAITDPENVIVWPDYSEVMDYELELACIIGKKGKDISKGNARDHIFGFTVFNDLSARDAQGPEMQAGLGPAKAKDFDDASPMGPCIVTLDELGDPYNLEMIARVNGEERSRGNSNSIHFSFEDMIAHVSQGETLYPGEIFGSGTVGGGCGLELMRFLSDGDVVELEIENIGILRNKIVRSHH